LWFAFINIFKIISLLRNIEVVVYQLRIFIYRVIFTLASTATQNTWLHHIQLFLIICTLIDVISFGYWRGCGFCSCESWWLHFFSGIGFECSDCQGCSVNSTLPVVLLMIYLIYIFSLIDIDSCLDIHERGNRYLSFAMVVVIWIIGLLVDVAEFFPASLHVYYFLWIQN